MNYAEIRKLSLKVFIGFLVLTALIAIVSVVSGDFGDFQLKVIATTFAVATSSICAMSCAAFIEKRNRKKLGLIGIAFSVVAALMVILGAWTEADSEVYWKLTTSAIIFAIAFAHAFLLALPKLERSQTWLQRVSSVAIGVLALQIVVAVWGEVEAEGYFRLLAVVAIVVGLVTLVIPILVRWQRSEGEQEGGAKQDSLALERVEGDVYRDATGRRYTVKEVDGEARADKR